MNVLSGILKESESYYAGVERKIIKMLKDLPEGSLKRRKIGNKLYWYLQKRVGSKVIHKYLGKEKPEVIVKKLLERKNLQKDLKKVMLSMKILKKANKVKSVRSR